MAILPGVIGQFLYFDTANDLRFIVPVVDVGYSAEQLIGNRVEFATADTYASAYLTFTKSTLEFYSPVPIGNKIYVKNSDSVYFSRETVGTGFRIYLGKDLTETSQSYYVSSSIAITATFDEAVWFFIIRTNDNKWIPLMMDSAGNNPYSDVVIIPCTQTAFGNIDYPSTVTGGITTFEFIQTYINGAMLIGEALKNSPFEPETDPYDDIDPTTTGGGDGDDDFNDSDDIDFPDDPELSAVSTGFVSLWSPSTKQMLDLSSFMWNADILTIEFWKKLIADPIDLIFGLNLVPLNLTSYIDGEYPVVVGLINTGVYMNHLSTQWVTFDCGTIDITEAWGAYLDYDPYTKLEIYLPFCGTHPLKVDDFMPGTISLKYKIDLLSGTCIAMLKSTKSNKHGDTLNSIVYQFMGNCAAQVPVTSQQFADAIKSAINIAVGSISMVAMGVGGAAAAGAARTQASRTSHRASTVSGELSTGASVVENVMNLKPAIARSGAIGSSGALISVRKPYLIFTRPRMARPENQNTYTGYPSFITERLGDLRGWTMVQAIHLEDIPCTDEEMNEIDALLKGGVIF